MCCIKNLHKYFISLLYFKDMFYINCFVFLFQGIQSSCREKQKCHLKISSQLLKDDQCPGVQRYLDVAFKCRPSEFLLVLNFLTYSVISAMYLIT